jgi:hypothetical protein
LNLLRRENFSFALGFDEWQEIHFIEQKQTASIFIILSHLFTFLPIFVAFCHRLSDIVTSRVLLAT